MLVVACGWATAAAGLEVPLKYMQRSERGFWGIFPSSGMSWSSAHDSGKPAGEWKLPPFKSDRPIYKLIKLGDEQRLVVFDKKDAKDADYTVLYFDANGNRDLTDDAVMQGDLRIPGSNIRRISFPAIDMLIKMEGKTLPYSYVFSIYSYSRPKMAQGMPELGNITMMMNTNCAYAGEFDLDGKHYKLLLGEGSPDGRFDAFCSQGNSLDMNGEIYAEGSKLFLTDKPTLNAMDGGPLCKQLMLDGKMYDVAVKVGEGKLILSETKDELVPLELPVEVTRMVLRSEDGKHSVALVNPVGQVMVPAGRYQFLNYEFTKKDKWGDVWEVSAVATTDTPYVTVAAKQGGKLVFGEPFTVVAQVPEYVEQNIKNGAPIDQVPLEFSIKGSGQEMVNGLLHRSGDATQIPLSKRNKTRPKEPSYKIVTAEGEKVSQGTFEYG